MKALISGAGIAGLATGIALRQAGPEVEIFERMAGAEAFCFTFG